MFISKNYLFCLYLSVLIVNAYAQTNEKGCPPQELILPCRCLVRDNEYQVWCSHSDLPRVLEGLKALGQNIHNPIDELILENNNLPSLPSKSFLPLKVMRLMLRYNNLERVSSGWLNGLEESLMELFIVEPDLRSLPFESLNNLIALEAVTIQSNLLKRIPDFSNLPKLRYLQVESINLVELSSRQFNNMPSLEKFQISGSPRLDRLEAGTLQDLPNLKLVNISYCGITWMHLRAITRLPSLTELSLIGNKISDAGMIGRGARELQALEIIRLDFNNIDKLNEAVFVDLPSLKKIFLSNNQIVELNHGAFHRVPKLRMLDLSNNRVRRVHPESFLQHSGSGLEELWLKNNYVSHISELRSILDALPRLTFLDMSYNSLESIPFGALRGHATLEELRLDFNRINVIDREAFMAMPALRELRLKNNSLSDRLDAPYWNLPSLKGLDLSDNYFRHIKPRLLMNIPSLRKIDFSGNDIAMIDPSTFLMNSELEVVNFSRNALTQIHPATFRHLLNLYELDVSNNELLEFVPGLPRGIEYLHLQRNLINSIPQLPSPDLDLPSLRLLDLSFNKIQRIMSGSLETMPKLKTMYFGQNLLQQLEENALKGLSKLEVLDFKRNRLSKIHPDALKDLSKLSELNLRENRLDSLTSIIFQGVPNLQNLDISKNQINEIHPNTLEKTRLLEEIDASNNALVNLPSGLYGMKNLKKLDLSNNRLNNIYSESLSSLVSLQELYLSKNFIQDLSQNAFSGLTHLTTLNLDDNEIVEIASKAIHTLPKLKSLNLSKNKLKEIPNAAFSELPNLQTLELQENDLRLIGNNAFRKTPHLLMLNLSYNHIVGMEDAGLGSLRSLEMLDVSNNELIFIASPSLERMEWLVELHLDNNRICSVNDATFNGMPRLRVLSLRNNKLVGFPENAVKSLRGNIAVLDIEGNPLVCSCSLLWLRAWLQEQSLMGPRCSDGTLLREMRLKRQECTHDEYEQNLTSECGELLPPGQLQNYKQWQYTRENNRTKLTQHKNNLAPPPEESEYFYDEFIDYAYNGTETQSTTVNKNIVKYNSSHYTPGDTPVIYAATQRNKTKTPDTPKGVVGSPSSSGFTFFGLPLPSLPNLNLNNILGGSGRMTGKSKNSETMTAERKTAIVNKPPSKPLLNINPTMRPFTSHTTPNPFLNINPTRKIPDLPEKEIIIGMMPPSHPEIEKGGFVPILPGNGGFKPMVLPNKTSTYVASIEKVNLHQESSSSMIATSTLPPSTLAKRGPLITDYTEVYQTTTERILIPLPTTKEISESSTLPAYANIDSAEEVHVHTEVSLINLSKRQKEEEQIKNLGKILKPVRPTEDTVTETSSESFEDIFKEVVDNVPLPPSILATSEIPQTTKSNIENLINFTNKDSKDQDLESSFSNNENKKAIVDTSYKKEVIGTPLSALLVPGGQQPQFRQSGRPSITKVQSPHHTSVISQAQSSPELLDFKDDDIIPLSYTREGKNGIVDTTTDGNIKYEEKMDWYFANYNKTNLEPYIGLDNNYIENSASNLRNICNEMFILLISLHYVFIK